MKDQIRHTIEDAGRKVQETIDHARRPASETLQTAAAALHDRAGSLPGGRTVADLAHPTAGRMLTTAGYVREHDVQNMLADCREFVRKHPGAFLLSALAAGVVAGRALRRAD